MLTYETACATPSDIHLHLPRMVALVETLDAKHVIELGTRTGVSTIAWLHALNQTDGRLWSVDIDDVRDRPGGIGQWRDHPAWTFLPGDSTDAGVLAQLPERADVVFLDGDHGRQKVLDELAAYMPRLSPGGVALLHDTRIRWSGEPDGTWPVTRALDEWCGAAGLHWQELPGAYGLGVVVTEW